MTQTTLSRPLQTPTLEFLKNWLYRSASAGDLLVYWRGYLCCDRMRVESIDGQLVYRVLYPAHAVGQLLYKAYEQGLVTLVQQKHEDFDYSYIAIRR